MRVATYRAPNFVFTEHEFELPLDHSQPEGRRSPSSPARSSSPSASTTSFRGSCSSRAAPERGAPAPKLVSETWWDRALKDYRLLLLDQRGTGRSTPVGSLPGMSPEEQAEYLTHFRADSIVRDAEAIRQELGVERWSVLGQSFGGFCVGLVSLVRAGRAAGGVLHGRPASARPHPDDVYRKTYERASREEHAYYERYPEDRERVT